MKILLGIVALAILMVLILLFTFALRSLVGDIIVTEIEARPLASMVIAVGKVALVLGVILLLFGVTVNLVAWLAGRNLHGSYD